MKIAIVVKNKSRGQEYIEEKLSTEIFYSQVKKYNRTALKLELADGREFQVIEADEKMRGLNFDKAIVSSELFEEINLFEVALHLNISDASNISFFD